MSLRLTLVALLVFAGYFVLPTNTRIRKTMQLYITGVPQEWGFYRRNRDENRRDLQYHRLNAQIPRNIKTLMEPGDVVAIPPETYLKQFFPEAQIRWAEPRFMYYMAGPLNTVPWDQAALRSATHAVVITPGNPPQVMLQPLRTMEDINAVAEAYGERPQP